MRRRWVAVGVGAALVAAAATVGGLLLYERQSYQPLAVGDVIAPGAPADSVALAPATASSPAAYDFRYSADPFTVVASVGDAGGRGVEILGVELVPPPPFESMIRAAGAPDWTVGEGSGGGPMRPFPAEIAAHSDLVVRLPVRWAPCGLVARDFASGSTQGFEDLTVRYRFWGGDHTVEVPLLVPLVFGAGEGCG